MLKKLMLACGENSCFFSLLGLHQGMFFPARGEERRLFSKGKLMPPLDTPGTQPPFFDVLVALASLNTDMNSEVFFQASTDSVIIHWALGTFHFRKQAV